MSNKVMMTGLALGKDVGVCEVCNTNVEWLMSYPSTLLWADKILLTRSMWKKIQETKGSKQPELDEAIKFVFDKLEAEGVIEHVDPSGVINDQLIDSLLETVKKDRELLNRHFPTEVQIDDNSGVPGKIIIEGEEYCSPYLYSVYAAFLLSKHYRAQCLFSPRVIHYCRYKFGLAKLLETGVFSKTEVFSNIFESYLPNIQVISSYALHCQNDSKGCVTCVYEEDCKIKSLKEIEKNLEDVLEWRTYDEVYQLKEVVNRIIERREEEGDIIDVPEILGDFQDEQNRINKRIRNVFPTVKRWTNMSTILSIPVIVLGVATGSVPIAVAGAGIAGLAKVSEEAVKYLSSKYSWVGFINSQIKDVDKL